MGKKKKNSEQLEKLVKSNFVSSLKENYLYHVTPSNLKGTVDATIIMIVYRDGSVKYAEKSKKFKRVLDLKDPNDVSEYQKQYLHLQLDCIVFYFLLATERKGYFLHRVWQLKVTL